MRRQLLHTVMSGKDGRDTTFDVSRRKILLATTTLAAASALGSPAHAQAAQAQTVTTAQAQAKYTPEQAKALEDWTYAVALDAANWGSPAVIMYNLRANDAVGPKPKAAPNSIWRMEDISTPQLSVEAGYVTPNVNVIYGFGFLDLGPEPIILTVPDSNGRYYLVEIVDMYSNAFAYAGGLETGYKGGKFALVGPGLQGHTSRRRPAYRLSHALDADSASRPRHQPGGSASGPEGHARDHGAGPRQVHRPACAVGPRL